MSELTGMSILKPHVITDAVLTSSTVIDIAPAAYAPGSTYGEGALCSVAGALGLITAYRSLQPGNLGHTPSVSPTWWAVINTMYQPYAVDATYAKLERVQDNTTHLVYESLVAGNVGAPFTDALKWAKVGATMRWAAFDNVIGTASSGASPMSVVFKPNASTTGLMLFELAARTAHVTMSDAPGGTVVYDKLIDLDATIVEDVYDWFFADFEPMTDVVLTDLPGQYYGAEISVTLTTTNGRLPSAGVIKPAAITQIGSTEEGASVGLIDFSVKNRDRFGNFEVLEGEFAKKATFAVMTEASRFNKIYRTLAANRATPCVYIGVDADGYEPLWIYGFFEDFSIDIKYFSQHLCSMRVIGLI